MASEETIRVVLRTPDASSRAQLANALVDDDAIDIIDETDPGRDLTLIHVDALDEVEGALLEIHRDRRTVVACAPNDPVQLASLLASGIRGYHCAGEPWSKLRDVLHLVHRGDARADPATMRELLDMYLRLRRQAVGRGL